MLDFDKETGLVKLPEDSGLYWNVGNRYDWVPAYGYVIGIYGVALMKKAPYKVFQTEYYYEYGEIKTGIWQLDKDGTPAQVRKNKRVEVEFSGKELDFESFEDTYTAELINMPDHGVYNTNLKTPHNSSGNSSPYDKYSFKVRMNKDGIAFLSKKIWKKYEADQRSLVAFHKMEEQKKTDLEFAKEHLFGTYGLE